MATIGVQAMMLKDSFADIGVYETLRKVQAVGYNAVEISQLPMTDLNVLELDRARQELGIDIAALSAAVELPKGRAGDTLRHDFDRIVQQAQQLDSRLLRIGMLPYHALESLEEVVAFAREANSYAERLRELGIGLYYHNHHVEFARHNGRHLLDIILEHSPAMGLELDVHWIQRGGLDPAGTIRKYAGRTTMVHLKDYRIGQLPPEAFALLDSGDTPGYFRHFRDTVQFAEVGEGNLDFSGILEASVAAGAEYLLVEQDELYGRSVWDALQLSHDNLVALGAAELFHHRQRTFQ